MLTPNLQAGSPRMRGRLFAKAGLRTVSLHMGTAELLAA